MRTVSGGPRAGVAAHGVHVTLPDRWEARLYLRDSPGASRGAESNSDIVSHGVTHGVTHGERAVRGAVHPAAYGHPDESMNPVLHLANFALPPGRGDYGSGAVERMGPTHAFVSLLEFDAVEADRPLFAEHGIPRPAVTDFAPNALQRRLPGQLGVQRFFTEHGRAFCLYVVLGSRTHAASLVDEVHRVVGNLSIAARAQL